MDTVSFDKAGIPVDTLEKIVDRAVRMPGASFDRLTTEMDLVAAHANGCPLDFDKLLAFRNFDFVHDIDGINRHICRETGVMRNCFVPRCAQ